MEIKTSNDILIDLGFIDEDETAIKKEYNAKWVSVDDMKEWATTAYDLDLCIEAKVKLEELMKELEGDDA